MNKNNFDIKLNQLFDENSLLVNRRNRVQQNGNGIYDRYEFPVLTRDHIPVFWQYDLNFETNPHLMMRLGINTTFNAGAIKLGNKYLMITRIEGFDSKSFFAVAESPNGIDRWKFRDRPIVMPLKGNPDNNVYDIRLTQHQDGWIYGLFCAERKDQNNHKDLSAALACCGIARTKDLMIWERLEDLKSSDLQHRNCVLHPEFVNSKYLIYSTPLKSFSESDNSCICAGLSGSMENASIDGQLIVDKRESHIKNGQGPAPIKTSVGWLHLAHGFRRTSTGLRFTIYLFLTDLLEPWKVIHRPGGHFIEPLGEEHLVDLQNDSFSNGWILDPNGTIFIYYSSSDTRIQVATTTIEKLIDYVLHTPEDSGDTQLCIAQRDELIVNNLRVLKQHYPDIRF